MEISILGCGNAGSAVAADLVYKGHNVTICKTSNALHNDHYNEILTHKKIILHENNKCVESYVNVTDNIKEAIVGKELLIIFIQTNYHEALISKICQYIEDGQIVLIEPGYLSSCYFSKYTKKDIILIEAESSPIDCRIISPGNVKVLFRNVRNPIGIYPDQKAKETIERLKILDFHFELLDSVVEAALHNPNLIVHTVGAILSVPRIEYINKHGGQYSMYKEVFTPSVWKLVKKLDEEKMEILDALGCRKVAYVDACKNRNSIDEERDAEEVFFDYAQNSSPDGPYTSDSRYITEDVPEGLVLLESLGRLLNIKTPVSTALIDIASAMLKRDFRMEGRSVDKLGKENLLKICNLK